MLILVRGLPGSGKSTFAKKYIECGKKKNPDKQYIHCEADYYHIINGVYSFDIARAPYAHSRCLNRAKLGMRQGKIVVVSNTFITISQMKAYVRYAKQLGIPYRIYTCRETFGSIHGVPDETMAKMRQGWQKIKWDSFGADKNSEGVKYNNKFYSE
jgi:tRNA uridine 5-carbamoylmethylation protein Kti12